LVGASLGCPALKQDLGASSEPPDFGHHRRQAELGIAHPPAGNAFFLN
jgi:hypothetical protein